MLSPSQRHPLLKAGKAFGKIIILCFLFPLYSSSSIHCWPKPGCWIRQPLIFSTTTIVCSYNWLTTDCLIKEINVSLSMILIFKQQQKVYTNTTHPSPQPLRSNILVMLNTYDWSIFGFISSKSKKAMLKVSEWFLEPVIRRDIEISFKKVTNRRHLFRLHTSKKPWNPFTVRQTFSVAEIGK